MLAGRDVGVERVGREVEGLGVRLLGGQRLDALMRLPAELGEDDLARLVDQPEGVDRVAVHELVAGRRPEVGVDLGEHVGRLGQVREEVEKAVGVLSVGDRRRLQAVHHVGELDGVPDEEDR